jgi:hypothetical protein
MKAVKGKRMESAVDWAATKVPQPSDDGGNEGPDDERRRHRAEIAGGVHLEDGRPHEAEQQDHRAEMQRVPERPEHGAAVAPEDVDEALVDPEVAATDGGVEIGRRHAQPAVHRDRLPP